MGTNVFVPQEDIYGRLPDGRRYLIAAAGTPILDIRARQLGILPVKPQPSETKADRIKPPVDGAEPAIVTATASALALAKKYGIDLEGVEGSGNDGRIIKRDVEALID